GRKHKPRECPAYGKVCTKCNKKNHFAAKCFQNSKNIHEMKVPENELDIYIDSVTEKVQENELNSDSMNKNVEIFYVVNVKSKPILGLKGCLELKLIERIDAIECSKISKNELIKQYKDVFTGTGEFPDEPYHITLKDNAIPVIHPPRRVPQALQLKLKETLDKLEKEKNCVKSK
ncbi:hypothetical protein AVEN_110868-1, partial [Araneus ventricosus]